MKEPKVSVCVLEAPQVEFTLHGRFLAKGLDVTDHQQVVYADGCVSWNGTLYQELTFEPLEKTTCVEIHNVKIGINFHWERTENQRFNGKLRLIANDGKICAINLLPVEDYLKSVISSEMKATSSLQLLKAHAVISRSWLLAQMDKRKKMQADKQNNTFFAFHKNNDSLIRWYDREDHILFDVCADDHCQRYQGITRADNPTVKEAVDATRGQILSYNDEICDARFSKCCGGVMERFSACWEDKDMPYLAVKRDLIAHGNAPVELPDLSDEQQAEEWILSQPEAFCNTQNKEVLSQVLNTYDQETTDFYRWRMEYTQRQLSELISARLKMDFGDIIDLIPLQRGGSGRITLLKIVGTKNTFSIGKELEIRRTLSRTHLLSSAFVVEKIYKNPQPKEGEVPLRFIIHGAGWGHGVGLCQIGAAVMGDQGYKYDQILHHYYPGTEIERMY